jgi:hypothetical protein
MLTMAASAVYLAALKHQNNNVGGGVLTFYLVATAWVTAKRRGGETSIFDWAALLIPLWAGIGGWINGLEAVHSPMGSIRSSRWDALFPGFRDAACYHGGCSHASAWWCFRRAAHCAPSLAHVLWAVHRHELVFPGTGQQGIPRLYTQNELTFYPGYPATDIADFLAIPCSLHICIQKNVDAARG